MQSRTLTWIRQGLALALVFVPKFVVTQSEQLPDSTVSVYQVLYEFKGGLDGADPSGGLVEDALGNLYGTTDGGGKGTSVCSSGCGVVYVIDAQGHEKVLHRFAGRPSDGAHPFSGLIRDAAGNLYGTTSQGGSGGCYVFTPQRTRLYVGCGIIFKLDTKGVETILHNFAGFDGSFPSGGLTRDSLGNLYGTTGGTVFKLDATGKLTTLHSFTGVDGLNPYAGVVRDSAGNLYGTTSGGGLYQFGVVFKLDTTGKYSILHNFSGPDLSVIDGAGPYSGLVRDSAGNLYGTTFEPAPGGVVFKVNTSAQETILYDFIGHTANGASPLAGLIRDSAGNLYGTTELGGGTTACSNGCGVVFKLSPTGQETVLHRFTGGAGGGHPSAGVIRDSAGNLYGTASGGSSSCEFGCGVVFKLTP